jgi:hypothetical protein
VSRPGPAESLPVQVDPTGVGGHPKNPPLIDVVLTQKCEKLRQLCQLFGAGGDAHHPVEIFFDA